MHCCICFLAPIVLAQAVPYPSWVELSHLTMRRLRLAQAVLFSQFHEACLVLLRSFLCQISTLRRLRLAQAVLFSYCRVVGPRWGTLRPSVRLAGPYWVPWRLYLPAGTSVRSASDARGVATLAAARATRCRGPRGGFFFMHST